MKIVKSVIFYSMMWLRGISSMLLGIIGGLSLLSGIGWFFVKGILFEGTWICLVGSFICFMLREYYDHLLLKLNPTGHDLILYK